MDGGIDTEKISLITGVDNLGADETGEQFEMEYKNTDTSTSSGSFNPTSLHKTYEETSFGGDI